MFVGFIDCSRSVYIRFIIGQNIRNERTKQKMPLHKLARLSGVNERLLDQYELGKGEITLHHLLKIACALSAEFSALATAVLPKIHAE